MRVGIVAEQLRQPVPGGIGTYTTGLLRGLRDLGAEDVAVEVIASKVGGPDPLADFGFPITTTTLSHRLQMLAWDRGIGARVASDLDVLHRTSLAGPSIDQERPRASIMIHDLSWRHYPELTTPRGVRWHEAALRRAVDSSASLIVPSAVIRGDLLDTGVAPDRVTVIGEGADHLPPADHAATDALLERCGIAGPFWLTVSTLEPRKNLERLIEAHGLSSSRGRPPWPLVVVGQEGWGPTLHPRDGTHLVGRCEGSLLAGLYERCGAFVYVPIHEGFGLPPLEAMDHGAPVVASLRVPSMIGAPVVAVCDATDVTGIRVALSEVMDNDEGRVKADAAGRAFAARHRWRDVAAEHLSLWRHGR
jgi:glycosyltransferase involved in cell wall biosynthesis